MEISMLREDKEAEILSRVKDELGDIEDGHYVYCVCREGKYKPCKVGIAENLHRRLVSLQVATPEKLVMAFCIKTPGSKISKRIETAFHKKHEAQCISGEWFKMDTYEVFVSLEALTNQNIEGGEKVRAIHWERSKAKKNFIKREKGKLKK